MANIYEFEFTDVANAQITIKQFPIVNLPLITINPALQMGHTYQVRVRAYVYNTWSNWGTSCNISIANAAVASREFSVETDVEGNETLIEKELPPINDFSVNAYPNPFQHEGGFSISAEDDLVMVYLYDALGNIVWQEQVKTNTYVQFASEELASGMYLLSAVNKSGISKSIRLIKTE
jgi:hypothetical protein